ncbi:MAG: imidazole glycerol phosphate synthase subunit HisH [Bacteroidales bacterium]|nr:imidazole glycerol phosphate synthase subunit HisH [Bacteroidales bacterium]
MIVIIDYGMGNLRSVLNKFNKIGTKAIISSKVDDIKNASKLVLPGVGHFANGMKNLREFGLLDALNEKVLNEKIPIIGICLGMQLLTGFSEEGNVAGLNWIKGKTIRFNIDNTKLKVPHMGWNSIIRKKENILLKGIPDDSMFYFVHSYYVVCDNNDDVLTATDYGCNFVSALQSGNIYGTQFHPEKSHEYGLQLLKNFTEI